MDNSQQEKKYHRRRANEIERRYKCQVPGCDKAYGVVSSLYQHVRLKHPDEPIPTAAAVAVDPVEDTQPPPITPPKRKYRKRRRSDDENEQHHIPQLSFSADSSQAVDIIQADPGQLRRAQRYINKRMLHFSAVELRAAISAAAEDGQAAVALSDSLKCLPPPASVITADSLRVIHQRIHSLSMQMTSAIGTYYITGDGGSLAVTVKEVCTQLCLLVERVTRRVDYAGANDTGLLLCLQTIGNAVMRFLPEAPISVVQLTHDRVRSVLVGAWTTALQTAAPHLTVEERQHWLEAAVKQDTRGLLSIQSPLLDSLYQQCRLSILQSAPSLNTFSAAVTAGVSTETALANLEGASDLVRAEVLLQLGQIKECLALVDGIPSSPYVRLKLMGPLCNLQPEYILQRAMHELFEAIKLALLIAERCISHPQQVNAAVAAVSAEFSEKDAKGDGHNAEDDWPVNVWNDMSSARHDKLMSLLFTAGQRNNFPPWSNSNPEQPQNTPLDFELRDKLVPSGNFLGGVVGWLRLLQSAAERVPDGPATRDAWVTRVTLLAKMSSYASVRDGGHIKPKDVITACGDALVVAEAAWEGSLLELLQES